MSDFWEGYVPEPDKRQQALDKKAENARELGLDYEPAQQEPVAIPDCGEAGHADGACGNRECLPSFNRNTTPQRTWVGLTDEDRAQCVQATVNSGDAAQLIAAIEAKLKEKNT